MTQSIALFAGSNRRQSFNHALCEAGAKLIRKMGHEPIIISLNDYPMPIFCEDIENDDGIPQPVIELGKKLSSCQGVFIASPEYNSSLTPLLKNTLDWLSRLRPEQTNGRSVFKNRAYAIGGASPGGLGGIRGLMSLRIILAVGLGAEVIAPQVSVGAAHQAFSEDGQLKDERSNQFFEETLTALIRASERY